MNAWGPEGLAPQTCGQSTSQTPLSESGWEKRESLHNPPIIASDLRSGLAGSLVEPRGLQEKRPIHHQLALSFFKGPDHPLLHPPKTNKSTNGRTNPAHFEGFRILTQTWKDKWQSLTHRFAGGSELAAGEQLTAAGGGGKKGTPKGRAWAAKLEGCD